MLTGQAEQKLGLNEHNGLGIHCTGSRRYIMSVCVCKGTNKLHTHLHTHTRECDKGSVVG